jgi:hypothetical protein
MNRNEEEPRLDTQEKFAEFVANNLKTPEDRKDFIYALSEHFCLHCGREYSEEDYRCHCTNDD